MKKVLFATTALVATAGVASADIALSGSAEMGIAGGDNIETQYHQDIDVTFSMTGTADNGLSFGAVIDLDESDDDKVRVIDESVVGADLNEDGDTNDTVSLNWDQGSSAFDPFDDGGAEVFISADGHELRMGDTDSAFDWALDEANTANNAGSIADDETVHAGYNGSYRDGYGDGQILRYTYTMGDFAAAVSYQQDGIDYGEVLPASNDGALAIGARYTANLSGVALTFGGAYWTADYGTSDDETLWGLSVAAVFDNGFEATVVYSDWNDIAGTAGNDNEHIGIGVGYSVDAITVHANYGEFDSGSSGYGLAASYDFGGGLSAHLGYGYSDPASGDDYNTWSLGMAMSF